VLYWEKFEKRQAPQGAFFISTQKFQLSSSSNHQLKCVVILSEAKDLRHKPIAISVQKANLAHPTSHSFKATCALLKTGAPQPADLKRFIHSFEKQGGWHQTFPFWEWLKEARS
jgi:hypothetical protein